MKAYPDRLNHCCAAPDLDTGAISITSLNSTSRHPGKRSATRDRRAISFSVNTVEHRQRRGSPAPDLRFAASGVTNGEVCFQLGTGS